MQPEEIQTIITSTVSILKDKGKKEKGFYPGYKTACELVEQIKPHAVTGYFPEKLFKEKAPNETPQEFEYRKNLYKALGGITRPYWSKGLSQLNRIWNEKNYTIKYPEIPNEVYSKYPPVDYFTKDFPNDNSIEAYFRQVVTAQKIFDPNAVVIISPENYDVPQNEMILPGLEIYCTDDVLYFETDKVVLVETDKVVLVETEEKSTVDYGNNKVQEGIVMLLVDNEKYYRVRQVGKKTDWTFEITELYTHNLGYCPAWKLRGYISKDDDAEYYESYFMPAVPALNDALCDSSTLRMSKFAHAFLQRWEYVDDCPAQCEGGYIFNDDRTKQTRCQTCGGTGKSNYLSALSVIQVQTPKPDVPMEDTSKMAIPPAGYVPLDHGILDFLSNEIDRNIQKAFEMLNMDVTNSNVKGSETATGKAIDREALFSFLLIISNELFDLLEKCINTCGKLRYRDAWIPVTVNPPQNFSIRNEADLTAELTEALNNSLPQGVIRNLYIQYADQRFNGDEEFKKRLSLIGKIDALFGKKDNEVAALSAINIVQKWQAVFHSNADQIIGLELKENPRLFEMDYDQQFEAIKNRSIEFSKDETEGGSAGADALKATVGGLTGAIEIVRAVASGEYDTEAAIALFMDRYNVTYEQAKAQIGTPQMPEETALKLIAQKLGLTTDEAMVRLGIAKTIVPNG